jgi:hypothetical protein
MDTLHLADRQQVLALVLGLQFFVSVIFFIPPSGKERQHFPANVTGGERLWNYNCDFATA